MEDLVINELTAIKTMVIRWKEAYLRDAPLDGGGEFLVEEFREEVTSYVVPYVRRLFENKYLNEAEVSDFLGSCYLQVEELQNALEELEHSWLRIVDKG
ncbi:MAG: hypothetical protein GX443_07145 [Deltaproteobacteria bacterium]|nr:hypothetical protein [Deltaproteobacteria bacterium]